MLLLRTPVASRAVEPAATWPAHLELKFTGGKKRAFRFVVRSLKPVACLMCDVPVPDDAEFPYISLNYKRHV